MTRAGIGAAPALWPTWAGDYPGRRSREKQRRGARDPRATVGVLTHAAACAETPCRGAKARRSPGTSSGTRRRGRRRTLAYPDLDSTAGGKGEEQRAPRNGCRDTRFQPLTAPRPLSGTAARRQAQQVLKFNQGRQGRQRPECGPLHYTQQLNISRELRSKSVCQFMKPIPC
ncbi:hypothetical protein NDU88_004426 [Pleurodeles waltl]|uniref:Uncharacterized protein n=1 Tax=Pleurodeles waltl TaxID=8319 RepID=A0AAV7LJV6_PLEWA|nr:hypothetical protein NDU88_004426 [Pleurodeles waltl]